MKVLERVVNQNDSHWGVARSSEGRALQLASLRSSSAMPKPLVAPNFDIKIDLANPLQDSVQTSVSSDQPMTVDTLSTPLIANSLTARPNVGAESQEHAANFLLQDPEFVHFHVAHLDSQ